MKKLTIILIIIFLSITLSSCDLIKEETTRADTVKEIQTVLAETFDKLTPGYEDLEWEDTLADGSFYGNASISSTQGDSIEVIHYSQGIAIKIIIQFQNATRQKIEVYFIDIYYVNRNNKIYINLELEGEPVTLRYSKEKLAESFTQFNTNDLAYLFNYLGYTEVNYKSTLESLARYGD